MLSTTPHLPRLRKLPVKTFLVLAVLLVLVIQWPQESAATAGRIAESLRIFASTVAGGERG